MLNKINFEIETITPMFLAGAEQGKTELRAASIKGLLRFWWRALQAESDIEKLRNRESQIFGSSDEGKGGGCSFAIRIIPKEELKPTKNKFPFNPQYQVPVEGKTFKINILEYLAYGTYEYVPKQGNVFTREYYPAKTQFDIVVSFTDEACKNEVLKAIYIWSIFGGIGSRSRNGFGSFDVINKEKAFEDIKEIISINTPYIKGNMEKLVKKGTIVSYSSFAQDTKLFKTKNSLASGLDSLADIGKIYKNGRIGLEKRHFFDKRQYIGSPIVEKKVTKSILDRHAKPYFIKIAKEEGNKYRAGILYLPSRYCIELDSAVQHDKKFVEVCNEFNGFLAQSMDTVI